ncbi:glycoside hydrolase family 43 protein [Lacrimispora sp. 38-1]|uniref:glycoside hydrolase family 43 protein n=1 Tax=Lacrimispora sp. 38-1 TaxID=3125778 RepID=UPI003CF94133
MGSGKKQIKAVKYGAAVLVMVLFISGGIALAAGGANEPPKRVSVHDPSIIKAKNGEYYIFGSHLAGAKSKDLVDWKSLGKDYDNVTDNWLFGNVKENLAESFRWAGYDDGDCAGGKYAVWAPDVIWNPYYNNGNGTKGAYMIYYSASSTWRRSCIGYAISQDIEGPYTYVGTVVYSGFTKNGKPDGNSQRNTRWDTDAIHLKKLIDSGRLKNGISQKWFMGEEWNHNYCPNAIDPTLFFDAQGQRLYMVYGSWSGGIYLLEMDRETGDAKYPGTDSVDKISGNYVDRYFGIHLAGGNHQSGEGPYIVYDKEAGYYYLYETYGALTANGGYNMRMFRSKEVTGPYLDAAGNRAADSYRNNDQYGVKLIGNYKLAGTNTGYKAAGHNSAFIDEDGQHYLVYHQRFDQGTEYHEVRVHQQFLNQKGWPVTAVYENRNEKAGHYPDSDITGTYEFMNHGLDTSPGMISPESITLLANGKIGGDREGTWKKIKGDRYDYITINMEGTEYHGVFFKQHNEKTAAEQVMTFTAVGDNNTCIWGSRE